MLERIRRVATRVMEAEGRDADVDITLVDDESIRELNREYRGKDAPTDVLSFSLLEDGGEEPYIVGDPAFNLLGDVVISVETAARQAEEYGHSLERELGFLTAHGVLHLLGYDHGTPEEEERMQQKAESVLASLGLHR